VETFLGDDLEVLEFETGRLRRIGINYCIQGGTAVTLAHGFYNLIRVSDQMKLGIQPIITVHDSVINYFPIQRLGGLIKFYRKNFTDYIKDETGINYEFDLMIGTDYTVPCQLIETDDRIITLKGDDYGLQKVIDRIGMENIQPLSEFNLNPTLSDPLRDLVLDAENASFGSCPNKSEIKFKLINKYEYQS
jgi:hypothetical protein